MVSSERAHTDKPRDDTQAQALRVPPQQLAVSQRQWPAIRHSPETDRARAETPEYFVLIIVFDRCRIK